MELDYVGLSLLITAVLTGIAGIIGQWRTATRVAAVEAKADTIKKSVDGTATESARSYAELLKEMTSVSIQLSDEKQRTARLEQAQSAQVAVAAAGVVKQVGNIVEAGVKELNGQTSSESLKAIDKNTKDTVRELKDKT